jgi:predicted HTH domain antitoxin
MPLVIPDEILAESRLTEAQARVEIAYRLYAAERLARPSVMRLSGLDAPQFEQELIDRGITIPGTAEADADDGYARGYARVPEDPADAVALAPHLPVTEE